MVEVMVILDGAAEHPRKGPTSLEHATTPVLDSLCRSGQVRLRHVTPPGLDPGSEVGIPTLLGTHLRATPARGLIEAAAAAIDPPVGGGAWRVDLPRELADDPALRREAQRLGLVPLRGHRFLALSATSPQLRKPWRVWPEGAALPRALGSSTVVVCAVGAAAGIGRLMGARVVVPPGATGDVDTDYRAKSEAAVRSMDDAERVVVHIAAPDEASHRRDRAAKIAALQAIDAEVLRPLRDAVGKRSGTLVVCPDHGTDPETGAHLAGPVPCLRWGSAVRATGSVRLVEREVEELVAR